MPNCNICGIDKPQSEYYKSTRTISGYRGACKKCQSSQAAARYAKTKIARPRNYQKRIPLPTQERLQEIFSLNDDGTLTRLVSCGNQIAGTIAKGKQEVSGYKRILVDGSHYLMHRVIWKMVYNTEPDHIDHINGDRGDNRIDNLRSVSRNQNARAQKIPKNNTSGFIGVRWYPSGSKWVSSIVVDSLSITIGYYSELADAINAYNDMALQYHGEFGREKVLHNIREAANRGIDL